MLTSIKTSAPAVLVSLVWPTLALQNLGAAQPAVNSTNRIVPPLAEWQNKIPATRDSTQPDYIVFTPPMKGDQISQTGNEHFLVFDGPDESLMAVWTQSTREGEPDQHIAFSRSTNNARTWAPPRVIA